MKTETCDNTVSTLFPLAKCVFQSPEVWLSWSACGGVSAPHLEQSGSGGKLWAGGVMETSYVALGLLTNPSVGWGLGAPFHSLSRLAFVPNGNLFPL
jgi:hypothetical protein